MNEKLLEYFNGDDLAASVWKSKYAQKDEITPDDMHWRMAKQFARIEKNFINKENQFTKDGSKADLSKYGQERDNLDANSIYILFQDFKYIIPQGSVMSQLGADSIGSLSNCFVIGQPEDSYGGIFQKDQEMAQLMKRRGGVGLDISTLRPEGVPTSNAAKSSTGAVSFMHRFSNTTREVAQKGRRGALMLSIDVNHPDVMEFIKIKRDLSQVTGANISIKLNDEFMQAVENDEDYILRWPCEIPVDKSLSDSLEYNELTTYSHITLKKDQSGYLKKIKAKDYWDEIIKSAHGVAEPGLMFWDNMVNYSPDGVYPQFRQVTTNPCSEIAMQPYDACRLIAVNLFSFVKNPFTDIAEFDFEHFYKINYEAMRLSDDLVELEMEHIAKIIRKIDKDPEDTETKKVERNLWEKVYKTAKASRRTGLGFTGLGDALAALGLAYDSELALNMIENIMDAKMTSELDCTIDMAITRGTFEGWNYNLELNDFYLMIGENFPSQAKRMMHYGRRNVSWSTVAPTGTVSLLAQTTSGIEPLFMSHYMRRKKVNPSDENVRVDFTDDTGDTWQEYAVLHPKFKDWLKLNDPDIPKDVYTTEFLKDWFKVSPWFGSTAPEIDWVQRVQVQSTIQKYITHSISSTINLPSDVSLEAVSEIYLESWKKGVKGITVYRDGSRSGVLVSNDSKPKNSFEYKDAVKRPKELEAHAHKSTSKGTDYHVLIGLMDSKPYEIFIDNSDNNYSSEGVIVKEARGSYVFKNGGDPVQIRDFMTPEQQAITRLVSMGLRHGTAIEFVVEQLQKIDGDMFSFAKSLARVLKKYIPEGVKASGVTCNSCGSENVIFEEGCHKCLDCGNSKCG
jgi:ribonucleoside-diphosphate reductase alpha chain